MNTYDLYNSLKLIDEKLLDACEEGDLNKVRLLLTNSGYEYHANIHYQENAPLHQACEHNHLHIVQYLLTSPELKKHADIHSRNDWALTLACNEGHFEMVKYLLASPDLKEHSNITVDQLYYAIKLEHYDIVDYLLISPDLKKNPTLNMDEDYIFKQTCEYADMKTMQYLIYDLDIKKTKELNKYLEKSTGRPGRLVSEAKKMFELRDINKQLNKDLLDNQEFKKKPKI